MMAPTAAFSSPLQEKYWTSRQTGYDSQAGALKIFVVTESFLILGK